MQRTRCFKGLEGKVAVLVGGTGGIGSATSRRLSIEGCSVVIGDLNADAAKSLAAELAEGGAKALGSGCDVSKPEQVEALFEQAASEFGGVDLVFANAADVSSDLHKTDHDVVGAPLEAFDRAIEVDLRGLLLTTRFAIPAMQARGGGSIVYTSSEGGIIAADYDHFYSMAKAGLNMLMRRVAYAYGRGGIRANAISPGMVMNENTRKVATKEQIDAQKAAIRTPDLGEVDEIASLAAFLLSDECKFLQGQVISVSGGMTMR